MLSEDYLKPFLLHENERVRDLVGEYFVDIESEDKELVPLILQACERYGFEDTKSLLLYAKYLIIDNNSLQLILDFLNTTKSNNIIFYLSKILMETPAPLYQKYRDHFAKNVENGSLTKDFIEYLDNKVDLYEADSEQLFQYLFEISKENEDKYIDEVDFHVSNNLLQILAHRQYPDEQRLIDMLGSDEHMDSYLEFFLVELAGRRRLNSAVPLLAEKLKRDEDYLPLKITDALARIRDPKAVELTLNEFPKQDENYKTIVSDMWGRIKTEESEWACIERLKIETDDSIKSFLMISLCDLLSKNGFDLVREKIKEGYDYSMDDIELELIAVSEILNIDLPEKEQWQRDEDSYQQRRIDYMREVYPWMYEQSENEYDDDDEDEWDDPYEDDISYQYAPITKKKKIGRNDPCPCGSGKKYKKCCLKKV